MDGTVHVVCLLLCCCGGAVFMWKAACQRLACVYSATPCTGWASFPPSLGQFLDLGASSVQFLPPEEALKEPGNLRTYRSRNLGLHVRGLHVASAGERYLCCDAGPSGIWTPRRPDWPFAALRSSFVPQAHTVLLLGAVDGHRLTARCWPGYSVWVGLQVMAGRVCSAAIVGC